MGDAEGEYAAYGVVTRRLGSRCDGHQDGRRADATQAEGERLTVIKHPARGRRQMRLLNLTKIPRASLRLVNWNTLRAH